MTGTAEASNVVPPVARIEAMVAAFRAAGFPDKVVAAIQDYLSGQGTLAWWLTGLRVTNARYFLPADALVGLLGSDSTSLDEIDRRLLDVCYATGSEWPFIMSVAADGPVEAVRDHLVHLGMIERAVLQRYLDAWHVLTVRGRPPAALHRLLLTYLPDRVGELVLSSTAVFGADSLPVIHLLLSAQPPYRDLAWRLAEGDIARPWTTGRFAPVLLAADRDFFFERIRPHLQRHVGNAAYEWRAKLQLLLAEDWPGRLTYATSLLASRYSGVRDAAGDWLVGQGELAIDGVRSLLTDPKPAVRAAAARVLGRIDHEQARALLVERRAIEQVLTVRQALFEAVGFPWATDADQANPRPFIDAITAEATRVVRSSSKPTLDWLNPSVAPTPCWQTGDTVPAVVVEYLFRLQSRSGAIDPGAHLHQFAALLDRRSAADWAAELLAGWLGQEAPVGEAWLLPLFGVLGDDRLVPALRARIIDWSKGARGTIAARAVQTLAVIGSEIALAAVEEISERVKAKQVQNAARQALAETARRRGISLDELADQTVPWLGFDGQGERTFDYGPRQFTVHLGLDLSPRVWDSTGKKLTALPRPLKSDDANKAAAAQAEWKLLKSHLKVVARQQVERLERALVGQRSWTVARWRRLFLQHPLLRPVATTLIWGLLTPVSADYAALFRPLADGTLTNAHDEPVELPAEGHIRLVHPTELDETTRVAWQQHLADYEVTPPFPQLTRPIVRVQPDERDQQWWTRYLGYEVNGNALKGHYQKAGWQHGSVRDGGSYSSIWKHFPAAGIEAILHIDGLSVGYEQADAIIERLAFARAGTVRRGSDIYDDLMNNDARALKLGEVPPVVFSEAAGDVATFATAGQYDPDWERNVWTTA